MNQFNGQQPQQPINQQQQMSLQIIQQQLANMTPDQQQALLRQHPQLAEFLHHYQQQRLQQQQMLNQHGQAPQPMGNGNSHLMANNGFVRNPIPGAGLQQAQQQQHPQQQQQQQQQQLQLQHPQQHQQQLQQQPQPPKPPRKKRVTKKEAKAQAAAAQAAQAAAMMGQPMIPPINQQLPPHQQQLLQLQQLHQQQQQQQQLQQQQLLLMQMQLQLLLLLLKIAPTPPPPVLESILPLKKIDPSSYWSTKAKEEGKHEIPSEVLLYEQITKRDMDYLAKTSNNGNLEQHTSLVKKLGAELKYYENLRTIRSQSIDVKHPNVKSIWGEGYLGYGNGFSDVGRPTQLIYPNNRKRFSRIPDQYIPESANIANAEIQEQLIPIRLEFDLEKDKFKLNDTFVWNNNERLVTLERFVSILMEDYRFKNPLHTNTVLQCIKEQLGEFIPIVSNLQTRSFPHQDIRIPIKLDITIANNQLVDQFEWDLVNPENNPEEFAAVMVSELSLSTEFVSLIAHSIREQCQLYTRALYTAGYQFDGSSVEEDEIRRFLSPDIYGAEVKRHKNSLPTYTPSVLEINLSELERLDKDKERESRRKRRTQGRTSTRRGGPTLPDLSDYPKTIRTVVPNSVLAGGVDLNNSTFMFSEAVERVIIPEDQFIKPQPVHHPPVFKREERRNTAVKYENLGDEFNVTIKLR